MTQALCTNCGATKFGAWLRCRECGVQSSGNRQLDIFLSDHYLEPEALDFLGDVLKRIRESSPHDDTRQRAFLYYASRNLPGLMAITMDPNTKEEVEAVLQEADVPPFPVHLRARFDQTRAQQAKAAETKSATVRPVRSPDRGPQTPRAPAPAASGETQSPPTHQVSKRVDTVGSFGGMIRATADKLAGLFGYERRSRGKTVAATESPKPRVAEKPALFADTDVDSFLECCRGLSGMVTPVLFERAHLTLEGKPKGGLRTTATDPRNGSQFSWDGIVKAHVEEASYLFAFGIAAFVASIHFNRWPKTAGYTRVRDRAARELAIIVQRGTPPDLAEEMGEERRREIALDQLYETVKRASGAALSFWKGYYDVMHGLLKGKEVSSASQYRPGTIELQNWLDDPSSRDDNPLALLQAKLAEAIGAKYKGPDFADTLERLFGSMTRELINRAITELNAPLTKSRETPSRQPEVSASPSQLAKATSDDVQEGQATIAPEMHRVEATEVSQEFAACWQAAGKHLEAEARRQRVELSWLKARLEPPFLEHLSFRLGNQLFFIRLEDVEKTVLGPGNLNGLSAIAKGCTGHACVMWMRKGLDGWKADRPGWGLIDVTTDTPIDPTDLVTDKKIEMTEWELHDFAVQIVRQQLEKEGRKIMSSQGNPQVDPSLWFVGDRGPEWVVVRAVRYPRKKAPIPANWTRIAASCSKLSRRGNFASVAVASADDRFRGGTATPLWRGGPMYVNYEGLMRRT